MIAQRRVDPRRDDCALALRCLWLMLLIPLLGLLAGPALGLDEGAAASESASMTTTRSTSQSVAAETVVLVLPFRIHSARPIEHLSESLADLLSQRLEAIDGVHVIDRARVARGTAAAAQVEPPDAELRESASGLGAAYTLAASVTELAGRYSLDARVVPTNAKQRSRTIVLTAENEDDLVARLGDLSERIRSWVLAGAADRVLELSVIGAGDLEPALRKLITSSAGALYDPAFVQADRERLAGHPSIARVDLETRRKPGGVELFFRVVRAEAIVGQAVLMETGEVVSEIVIRGNRRIEADAIGSSIHTKEGEPLNRATLARDVRAVYSLGFFRNVNVLAEKVEGGLRLVFEVEENPVIREIAIKGNDNLDTDKIQDVLTLTTGSTLDYPLLHENVERIEQLYRAEGYHLADVDYEIEETTTGAVTIDFDVEEGEKLKLRKISFDGNEALSDRVLAEGMSTKRWRFWSWATSWFDHTGTYSEPIFARDVREIEKKYTNAGYLQAEIGEPQVDARPDGLYVTVNIKEGPQFHVGKIDVSGDETVDLEALREKLRLSEGDVFNRSYLTKDVETLEQHYTDRGFYFASVRPLTALSGEEKTVDVRFAVEKGPLYFVRHVDIAGNTRTIDPVIRREMKVVEGQLYSARAVQVSTRRLKRLNYFEDLDFQPKPTDDPSQLDLEVNVVERPTGSFSLGAGYSSQDGLVFTGSLSQANLFGRGYAVNLSVDVGGRTNRYYFQIADPYFLGSTYSFGGTIFLTDVSFDTFEQHQKGFNFVIGHALSENHDTRGSLHYNWASRQVRQPTGVNAAAPIFREILQGNKSTSLVGVSFTRDTRDDRFSATRGVNMGATLEYAGLGGFARFLRAEARGAWYLGAPHWLLERSSFVLSTRIGYALPLNDIKDWDLALADKTVCDDPSRCANVARLDQIDTDLRLPLTERYFLGGIGNFQLRGYRARSVGPRRAILQRSGLLGTGDLFHPVGTQIIFDAASKRYVAVCQDTGFLTQGNGNGRCNALGTKDLGDFADLKETDVVGGNSFISSSAEYRFPISREVGLQGVFFMDMGNAFYEGQNLFDVTEWRYGYGGGVLWFSPFGPLQLVLGFPVNPRSFDDSPVFEFSVGGFGL